MSVDCVKIFHRTMICFPLLFLQGLLHRLLSGFPASENKRRLCVPKLGLQPGLGHSHLLCGHNTHLGCQQDLLHRGLFQTSKSTNTTRLQFFCFIIGFQYYSVCLLSICSVLNSVCWCCGVLLVILLVPKQKKNVP